jgi:allophanate hydrolase subunit 2
VNVIVQWICQTLLKTVHLEQSLEFLYFAQMDILFIGGYQMLSSVCVLSLSELSQSMSTSKVKSLRSSQNELLVNEEFKSLLSSLFGVMCV